MNRQKALFAISGVFVNTTLVFAVWTIYCNLFVLLRAPLELVGYLFLYSHASFCGSRCIDNPNFNSRLAIDKSTAWPKRNKRQPEHDVASAVVHPFHISFNWLDLVRFWVHIWLVCSHFHLPFARLVFQGTRKNCAFTSKDANFNNKMGSHLAVGYLHLRRLNSLNLP